MAILNKLLSIIALQNRIFVIFAQIEPCLKSKLCKIILQLHYSDILWFIICLVLMAESKGMQNASNYRPCTWILANSDLLFPSDSPGLGKAFSFSVLYFHNICALRISCHYFYTQNVLTLFLQLTCSLFHCLH